MPFLTASWLDLALLNYDAPPSLLTPLVPRGTELDTWHGRALVSVVGFYFADTRVLGLSIPGHRSFEEVNLRFYVRRDTGSGPVRRGVVFVRELVPRLAIAAVARALYNEPYLSVPMRHSTTLDAAGGRVEYGWEFRGRPYRLAAEADGAAAVPPPGSEAEFITEHYWGYTRQRDGSTLEYEVRHPPWRVWTSRRHEFSGPAAALYGPAFGEILSRPPASAFVAEGSAVSVYSGRPVD
jgi:uncharacterized protein